MLISKNEEGFTTTDYHNPTFSDVYFNFNSFKTDEYKHGSIFNLFFRILILFISSRVVDAMLPITMKGTIILKLELVNIQVFHL